MEWMTLLLFPSLLCVPYDTILLLTCVKIFHFVGDVQITQKHNITEHIIMIRGRRVRKYDYRQRFMIYSSSTVSVDASHRWMTPSLCTVSLRPLI